MYIARSVLGHTFKYARLPRQRLSMYSKGWVKEARKLGRRRRLSSGKSRMALFLCGYIYSQWSKLYHSERTLIPSLRADFRILRILSLHYAYFLYIRHHTVTRTAAVYTRGDRGSSYDSRDLLHSDVSLAIFSLAIQQSSPHHLPKQRPESELNVGPHIPFSRTAYPLHSTNTPS